MSKKQVGNKKFYAVILILTLMISFGASIPYMLSRSRVDEQNSISSENSDVMPDRYGRPSASDEMRGVWVPFLSLDGVNKAKIDTIVKKAKESGMNTIFFHVRPFGDALYKSEYYPWSHLINGVQGQAPENGFDPLAYAVEAAHRENMELHAWLNPLRIKHENGLYPSELSNDNPCVIWRSDGNDNNDDWVIDYKSGIFYNPAIPEVRQLIADGVREIVERYNVDGIHWDDYFYPAYDESFDDSVAYGKYRADGGELSLSDWRIQNINELVSSVYSTVKEIDSSVAFGISPAGNIENCIAAGADVRLWGSSSGYVDYLCPQLYWTNDNTISPYREVCFKWRDLVKSDSVKLYVGLALYKAGSDADKGKWQSANDIIKDQVLFARSDEIHADGFVLYSYDYLDSEQTVDEMKNLMSILE